MVTPLQKLIMTFTYYFTFCFYVLFSARGIFCVLPKRGSIWDLESKIFPLHHDLDLAHLLQLDLLRWKAGLLCRLTACYRFHEVKIVQSDSDTFLVVAKRIQPAVDSNSLFCHTYWKSRRQLLNLLQNQKQLLAPSLGLLLRVFSKHYNGLVVF